MHKSIAEALALVAELMEKLPNPLPAEIVLAPPFTALSAVRDILAGTEVALAGQNACQHAGGAFTGEISASMLKDAGCTFVILGHSERRQLFGEDDALIHQKIKTALEHGLKVIFCLGETLAMREQNRTAEVVRRQLEAGLQNLTAAQMENLVVAYEPVWAIGTGKTATPEQAGETHAFIRGWLERAFGEATGAATRILYGGSVNPKNCAALLAQKNIDGALVGGASLIADSFCAIIDSTHSSCSE